MIINFKIFENDNIIINKSFNITQNDIDELLDYIVREYDKNDSWSNRKKEIDYYKNLIHDLVTTSYSKDKKNVIVGIENFPPTIELYRIIELDNIEDFNPYKLGRYWCYDKNWLYNPSFHSSVGFEKNKKDWYIITAIFKKEDIDIDDTLQMLIVNTGEREIRTNNTKPIKYKIEKYDKDI